MADDAFLHKIDEPSTLAGIKHLTPNTSKELQDIVVEKAGRLPEVTRFCTSLTKPTDLEYNMRRWWLVLICLKSILIPALREYIVPRLTVLYNELKCNHKIDLQTYPTHLKRYPPTNDFLNYEAVNNNKAIHGNKKAKYDYKIRNAVELSKLFLQSHMGHYTGFNHTCDSSAVLELIIKIDKFPPIVKSDAENVKIYIGNLWARCDFSVWTAVKYSESFQMMEKLVKDLSLSFDKEVQLAEEIQILKIDGHHLFFDPEMIEVVHHCMVRLDASLEQLPKETDDDYLRIKNEGDIGNIIQTLYDLRWPRRHQVGYTFKGREVRMAGEETYDPLFADSIRTNAFEVKPTRVQDDVEINGYKGASNADELYKCNVVCDSFVVDCIVDRKLNRTCVHTVEEFQECIEEIIQWSETLSCFNKKVEKKLLSIVKTQNSCLCQYLLNHTSNNTIVTPILVNALHSSMENDDVNTAKFIGWQIARNFLKSLNVPVYDIWLASLCSCSRLEKKPFSWFCSKDVTIIIMVPHLNKEVINKFFGIPIKQIVYHCETFKEAQAISRERAKLLERDLNIQCHVPGPLAEKLFNSHRRLSLVSPSEIKSIDFKDFLSKPTFLNCSCIQLYCYVKGAIPIGENHFPCEIQGIPTDVIEGFPRFSSNNLKIGDCVTNLKMEGTLGGFCLSYGREAFLTCAHVMIDWDTLLTTGNKYHMQTEFVYNNDNISNGPSLCGTVVNHKFTHDNPRKTSTDVALIEIANGVSVSEDDCVNTRGKEPLNYAQLGLKSRFLHDSYIRSLHGLSGQSVEVVCAGAVSGFNCLVRSISEKPEHVLEREGLQSASTNLETRTCNYLDQQAQVSTPVHMRAHVPAIIHESRKEEMYSRRTLRFYNQLAVNNIPFEQGDSGACIYITNGYTETGCLGMAIADLPGGGCIVTPMAKLLEKLGLI